MASTKRRPNSHPGARLSPKALVQARGHFPVWSVKSIALLSVLTVGVATAVAFAAGRRPVLVELEWTLVIVAGALFAMLLTGLYRGVRLRETEPPSAELTKIDIRDWTPDGTSLPDIDCPLDAFDGGDDGCLGAIVGFLLSFLVLIVLVMAVWLFLQVALVAVFVLLTAIYWVLHLALRQVFAHSADCRGNLTRSLGFATVYTLLYTGWLFALLILTAWLTRPAPA
jgi:hypothetical protein